MYIFLAQNLLLRDELNECIYFNSLCLYLLDGEVFCWFHRYQLFNNQPCFSHFHRRRAELCIALGVRFGVKDCQQSV